MGTDFRMASKSGFVPSQLVVKAMLTGKPYPIRLMYLQGGNPLLTYANAGETFEALNRLSFLAVTEIFLTPTAQLADIVLPAATNFSSTTSVTMDFRTDSFLPGPKSLTRPESAGLT